MNLLIIERKIGTNLTINGLKLNSFNQISCHFIHSKSCIQRNVFRNKPFLWTQRHDLFIRRNLNFARIRSIWRTIRLKDKGVEHNFLKDGIDRKTSVLVYKAEFNRITSLGGILFPALTILGCTLILIWEKIIHPLSGRPDPDFDPHYKPSLLEKHFIELMIILSIIHISTSKRYVLRMYFNKNSHMFTVSTWRWYVPFKTKTFECKPGSAVESKWFKDRDLLIYTFIGNCRINRKRFFVYENHFIFPVYYNVLFGYSQPSVLNQIDFHSDENHPQIAEQVIRQRNRESSSF